MVKLTRHMIWHLCDVNDAEGVTRQSHHSSHKELHSILIHKHTQAKLEALRWRPSSSKAHLFCRNSSLKMTELQKTIQRDNPPSESVVLCSWCEERESLCMDVLGIDLQPDMTSDLTNTPVTQEMCV